MNASSLAQSSSSISSIVYYAASQLLRWLRVFSTMNEFTFEYTTPETLTNPEVRVPGAFVIFINSRSYFLGRPTSQETREVFGSVYAGCEKDFRRGLKVLHQDFTEKFPKGKAGLNEFLVALWHEHGPFPENLPFMMRRRTGYIRN
jgi:hypothetical protein